MRTASFCVAVVIGLVSVAESAPILINGSFEDGPAMNGELCPVVTCQDVGVVAGSAAIPGWDVFSASGVAVDYLGSPWDVSDGAQALDLDGLNALSGGVSQTIATRAGYRYSVLFDLSGNPHGTPALKTVRVSVDGVSHDYTHDWSGQSQTDLRWDPIEFSFIASGPAATLSFTSLTGHANSYGALIDNVRVTVPEPATLLLVGAGLVAIRARRRHAGPRQRSERR